MAMTNHTSTQEALRDFHLQTQRPLDRLAGEHGASLARIRLLSQIASEGSVRFVDLLEAFGQAPRTITEAIDALEADGLAERRPDPTDRRAKRISLTPAGEAMLQRVQPLQRQFCEELFQVLSDEESAQFSALLGRLNHKLRELGGRIESAKGGME
jgi:DNA-binding MarR family transcriptional regulator